MMANLNNQTSLPTKLTQTQQALTTAQQRIIELEARLAEQNQEIDYKRLFEQTQATLIKTEALYETTRLLSVSEELPTVLQAIIDGVTNALDTETVFLTVFNVQPQEITHLITSQNCNLHPEKLTYQQWHQGIIGQLIQECRPLLLPQNQIDHETKTIDCLDLGKGSKLLVPFHIRHHAGLQGVLVAVNQADQRDFVPRDLKLISAMAGQIAIAIENSLMFDEIEQYSQKLEAKNSALARLNTLKDEFLTNTSHSLRMPLNGIIGIAESMLDGVAGKLTSSQSYNLSMMVSSGRRLMNLINDVLDSARFHDQSLVLQIKPVDLYSIADIILTFSQPMIKNKHLYLRNEVDRGLPPIAADEDRLQQILYNLIENAIKHTKSGTISISAKVVSWQQPTNEQPFTLDDAQPLKPEALEITVSDTGTGIPPEKLASIEKAFETAKTSLANLQQGTGLGLAIAKKLVELQGGTLTINSTVGQGCKISFTLPVSKQRLAPHQRAPQEIAQVREAMSRSILTTPRSNSNQFTALIVDDEPLTRLILKNQLSLHDFKILEAEDGFEALEVMANITPDIILLDIMMPNLSGYDVCFKIRQVRPAHELPIILLTARNQVSDMIAGFEVGANDYLIKPIGQEELLARIKTHLSLTKINTAYGRFVPHEFLRLLNRDSIVDVRLGDQVQQQMTVLFSDIRSFTAISENMTPKENFEFINSLLNKIGPVIRQHHGFIDKYIGDSIMALFPEQPDDAVQAAIDLLNQLDDFNHDRAKAGQPPVKMGIGIHTGPIILGTVGEAERMETTVISDVVNTAARIEGLTKRYGTELLISRATLRKLNEVDRYHHRFMDRVQVKGKRKVVEIYEIFDADPATLRNGKQQTKHQFETAIYHFHQQNFAQTVAELQSILDDYPNDKAVQLYLQKAIRHAEHGVPADWDGVTRMDDVGAVKLP